MLDLIASLDTLNEQDRYTVTLSAGVQYFIEVECGGYPGQGHGPGKGVLTLEDSVVSLYAAQGRRLDVNDDGGVWPDSRLVFTPTRSGDYQVGVSAFQNNQMGTYRVKVFEDDFRGSAAGGSAAGPAIGALGAVVAGGSAGGIINYVGDGGANNGDVDVFALNLIGGLHYRVEVLGAATGDGTLLRPELHLLTSGDFVLASALSDTAGSNLTLGYDPIANAMIYAAVQDWFIEQGGSYRLVLSLGTGSALVDRVVASGFADGIAVLAGDDRVYGLGGDDTVLGGLGDDLIDGGTEADLVSGGAGADTLIGGLGDDVLQGGRDRDVLDGGAGADLFIFDARASVAGAHDALIALFQGAAFELGADVIDLTAIDADVTQAGDQAFIFDGTTGIGHLWLETRGDKTFVLGETDGSGRADFVLAIRDGLVDPSAYGAGDFVL